MKEQKETLDYDRKHFWGSYLEDSVAILFSRVDVGVWFLVLS